MVSLDSQRFRRVCSKFATGITVVTVRAKDGEPHGLTVNSFTSVSLDPPLVLVCLDHRAKIRRYFHVGAYFGVNVLDENQRHLSLHFARTAHDRFDGVPWHVGEIGVPLLCGVLASLECELTKTVRVGDHSIAIAKVLHTSCRDGRPLIYFASAYHRLEEVESKGTGD